jgi:hypothetical protein
MKIEEIKQIAKQHSIKLGKATKNELICAIQQAEGNQSCFDSNSANTCEQHACLWRADCA